MPKRMRLLGVLFATVLPFAFRVPPVTVWLAGDSTMAPTTGANTSPSQKPVTTPPEPKGKESNSESPKR